MMTPQNPLLTIHQWQKIVKAITSNDNFDPPVNIKLTFEQDNNGGFSTVWWDEVERNGFDLIEWIEIKPIKSEYIGRLVAPKRTDYTSFIKACLDDNEIPYTLNDGVFKIENYTSTT